MRAKSRATCSWPLDASAAFTANANYPARFIYDNLAIEVNVIDASHRHGVDKLLFLGSSCIYPKLAPQPMKEEYLLTGTLEPTNEPYAIAKIAGLKMCAAYNREHGTESTVRHADESSTSGGQF